MTTVRFQVSPVSQIGEPPVHAKGPSAHHAMGPPAHPGFACFSVHAMIADARRRDLCRYVQYALRRLNSTPVLVFLTAHRGRGSRR
jgi:hypothetical protein